MQLSALCLPQRQGCPPGNEERRFKQPSRVGAGGTVSQEVLSVLQHHLLSSTDQHGGQEAKCCPQFVNTRLVVCDVPEKESRVKSRPAGGPASWWSFIPVPGIHKVLQHQLKDLQKQSRSQKVGRIEEKILQMNQQSYRNVISSPSVVI